MADKKKGLLSTCPICGYTDSSADAEVLQSDIEAHMRSAHNMEPTPATSAGAVKATGAESTGASYRDEPPAGAPVANLGNAPSGSMAPPNEYRRDNGEIPGNEPI